MTRAALARLCLRVSWPLDRRDFLLLTGATLLSPLACGSEGDDSNFEAPPEPEPNDGARLVSFDPASISELEELFPLGVQAGGMTATGAILWTYAADNAPKRLRVWREAMAGQVLLVHDSVIAPADGYIKRQMNGLGPAWYRYTFSSVSDDARSPIGKFRTAFGPGDLRPLLVSGLTCTRDRLQPWEALKLSAEQGPELYCHLGDMSYNDGAATLSEYRAKWHQTLSDPGYRAAYAAAGLYATWDDHEVDNGYDPETMDPAKLAAAKQAYFETVAVRRGDGDRLWCNYRWGHTAEFFVVDSRSERRPSTMNSLEAQYLGRQQMDWLKRALAESPCHFKIVLNSVPMTRLSGLWDLGLADRWQGYQAQRDELLQHLLSSNVRNVYFLSGDFHCGFVTRLEPEGPGRQYWEIAVGPTGNGPNPIAIVAELDPVERAKIYPEGQFLYGSPVYPAVTTLKFDPLRNQVHVRFLDARAATRGAVLFDQVLPS